MKILSAISIFLLSQLLWAENCDVTLQKFCPSGEKECVNKNMKSIGNKCYAKFYLSLQKKEEMEHGKCLEELDKYCKNSKTNDCYEKNKLNIPSSCREKLSVMFNGEKRKVTSPYKVQGCVSALMNKCKLDMKLMEKDPNKATSDFNSCLSNAKLSKSDECNKIMKMVEKDINEKGKKNIKVIDGNYK